MKKTQLIHSVLIWMLASLSITHCHGQTPEKSSFSLSEVGEIPVLDNQLRISEFEMIQPLRDHYVIVHRQPNGITIINLSGQVVSRLGQSGRGPFEWQRPRFIQHILNKIVIWDSENLKFLVFDNQFEPVEELMGVRHAINGFSFSANDDLAVFHQPRFEDGFIKLYRKDSNGELSLRKSLGELSGEGRTLLFLERAGDIVWNGNNLVWVDPAIPELNIYHVESDRVETAEFEDSLFSVDYSREIGLDSQSDFEKVREFVFENSRIVSLNKLEDLLLAEVEHRKNRESVLIYHLFDLDYNHLGSINPGYGGEEHYIRGAGGNRLYFWGEDYTETGQIGSIRIRELVFEN